MLKRIIHLFFILSGGTVGYLYFPNVVKLLGVTESAWYTTSYFGIFAGALIFFVFSIFSADYVVEVLKWIEEGLVKIPVIDLMFGTVGLIIGLLVAYLINISLQEFSLKIISEIIPLFLTIIIGYLGFQVGFRRREEFMTMFTIARRDKTKKEEEIAESSVEENTIKPKILDTSVIIDGRIADICQTKFLEGTIVIPQFVLKELQHIADS